MTDMIERAIPQTVQEARSIGSPRYYTGKPCKRGHLTYRYTGSKTCAECFSIMLKEKRDADISAWRAKEQASRERTAEKRRAYAAKRYHSDLSRAREIARRYEQANRDKSTKRAAKRKAVKLRATVIWANLSIIAEIYRTAREKTVTTGVQHHVDHIIPLQGETVCGLHVESNLRVITASKNCSKRNKLIDTALK